MHIQAGTEEIDCQNAKLMFCTDIYSEFNNKTQLVKCCARAHFFSKAVINSSVLLEALKLLRLKFH